MHKIPVKKTNLLDRVAGDRADAPNGLALQPVSAT